MTPARGGPKKEQFVTKFSSVLSNERATANIKNITVGPGIGPGLIPVGPVAYALGFGLAMLLCKLIILVVGSIGA